MKSKSNKHKLEKRKKNRDEWGREELTSEEKESHGEGVVARDAAERERERESLWWCAEREKARACNERERALVRS